jgi:hypothetical protein
MLSSFEQRQTVEKARARIADPNRWCQGVLALMADGTECGIHCPRAVRFCALGALAVEYLQLCGGDAKRAVNLAKSLASVLSYRGSLVRLNDMPNGHARVLALFDKALAE